MSKQLTTGEALIESFFKAVHLKHLDQCQTILDQLEIVAQKESEFKPWCSYLQGILVFDSRSDWAEAERIFTELLQSTLEPVLRGRVLFALGRTYDIQGNWENAIEIIKQALSISMALGQMTNQVKAWNQMALTYQKGFVQGSFGLDELHIAVEYCQRALNIFENSTSSSADSDWSQGTVWNTLGIIYMHLGQWDQALACYQRHMAICHALDHRYGMGASYNNQAEIYQKRGRDSWPKALATFQKALNLIREFNDRYIEVDILANLAYLYQGMGEYEDALDYYDQAIQVIETLRSGISSEAAQTGFFGTIVDTYANAVLTSVEAEQVERAFDYVERARARAFLDILAERSPDLARQMETGTITLADVQANLPPDALLLEFFTTGLADIRLDRQASRQGIQRHRFPAAKVLIFAITHDRIKLVEAGLSPNDLRPKQLDSVIEQHFLDPQIRRVLYDRLIAPVIDLLDGKRRLYLVPHGPLHYIPFQVLVRQDGETLLNEDGPHLIYAPSATLLFRYRRPVTNTTRTPCLAIGYNNVGQTQLHFAEQEAHNIAHLLDGQALTGTAVSKAALFEQAANTRLLHFSCHGDFDPQSPLKSALHIAPNEIMTALEVMQHLQLNCDLVTLSACESGLTQVRRGDELIGFLRAFMYAGTPALICTLWRVDDRSTWILMNRFYQGVQAGLSFADALKQAQLYLRNLTRKEALDIWVRFSMMSQAQAPSTASDVDIPAPLFKTPVSQYGQAYLRGRPDEEQPSYRADLHSGDDQEKIFADPFYWAPFILVGAQDASSENTKG